jgi:REP element-mobilizing transposase RayT
MSYWRLYYHFVWGTKKSLPLIETRFEDRLHGAIAAKAQESDATVHAVGGIEDHVHLVVSVPPKISLSSFIGGVKGTSSHFVNYVIQPRFTFVWQTEYGVLSFSEKGLSSVVSYVLNQSSHYHRGNIKDEMERFI